ncbi:MAG: tripartite tricarboxylate transporter substrate binding protein [Burkholderiales bacterium]|nr:tripartite tricarboxylate transporter substrate binding protein [Burkholderiales bacterium]
MNNVPMELFKRLLVALFAVSSISFGVPLWAQSYPNKPVKLIVPFGPGGFTDVVARIVGQKLSSNLGQQFVIENKVGAGSTIGTDFVAKSAPDGYTLVMISTTHVISPWIYKNMPYDPIKGFTSITKLVDAPYVLVVNPKVPANHVKEYIALAKSSPDKIHFASSGNGSSQHLMGELFMNLTGVKLEHVPYKSSSGATTDLMAGIVESSFAGIPNVINQIKQGQLRALGVTSLKRSAQLPDIPSLHEAGVTNYDASVWLGLLAPVNTPKEIVLKLNAELAQILNAADTQKALAQAGVVASPSSPEVMGDLMASELNRWGKIIKETGMKL